MVYLMRFFFVSVLDYPCNLLQIDKEFLATKLTSRVMKTTWGGKTEEVVVTNNIQQAESTRDALAKGIYSRIFDFLVEVQSLTIAIVFMLIYYTNGHF